MRCADSKPLVSMGIFRGVDVATRTRTEVRRFGGGTLGGTPKALTFAGQASRETSVLDSWVCGSELLLSGRAGGKVPLDIKLM